MDYEEFIAWMFGLERFGIKLGLENISEFMTRIGSPQREFKSVHVAGTNGKGSVCAFLAEILKEHGLKVGLYTSPHLVDFRERIKINGHEIPKEDVLRIGLALKKVMEEMIAKDPQKQLTFFEFTTGMAFKHFQEQRVDLVVTEVGMGGRLDATNVIEPEVAAITRIGLEHTNYLGKTIADIAREKAGIIKKGASVVTCERSSEALSVISSTVAKKSGKLVSIGGDFEAKRIGQTLEGTTFDFEGPFKAANLKTRLLGNYQAENAACAITIISELRKKGFGVTDAEIRSGLLKTEWPGRLDIVSRDPFLMFDGSHNPDGVATTARVISELQIGPLTYVLGCMDDKDAKGIAKAIAPTAAKIISTQARYKRALSSGKLAAIVKSEFHGPQTEVEDDFEAFETALREPRGKGVCVIGSLYLVGDAMTWWKSRKGHFAESHKV